MGMEERVLEVGIPTRGAARVGMKIARNMSPWEVAFHSNVSKVYMGNT